MPNLPEQADDAGAALSSQVFVSPSRSQVGHHLFTPRKGEATISSHEVCLLAPTYTSFPLNHLYVELSTLGGDCLFTCLTPPLPMGSIKGGTGSCSLLSPQHLP